MRAPMNGCFKCNSSRRRMIARSAGDTAGGWQYAMERASSRIWHCWVMGNLWFRVIIFCAQHSSLGERAFQKIILQRQLPNLGVPGLQINGWLRHRTSSARHVSSTFAQLPFSFRNVEPDYHLSTCQNFRHHLTMTDFHGGTARLADLESTPTHTLAAPQKVSSTIELPCFPISMRIATYMYVGYETPSVQK